MNKKYFKLFGVSLLTGLLALSSCDNSRKFSSISDSSSNDDVLVEDFNKLLAPTNVIFDADTMVLSWNTVTGIKTYDIHVNGKIIATETIKTETIVVEEEKVPSTDSSASSESATSESATSESNESSPEEKVEVEIIPEQASISLDGKVDLSTADIFLFSVRAKGTNQNSKYSTYLYDKNASNTSKGLFLYADSSKEVILGINPHSAVPLEANLEIPEGVKEISVNAFNKKTSITSLKLPSTLEKIGEGAFANTRFSKIDLKDCVNLVEIGDYAFEKNTSLANKSSSKIKLPASVKRIGTNAFNETNVYMEVPEDSKLEYVGDYALYGSKITEFYLPNTVTYVGKYAFGDTTLAEITYSESLFNEEIPEGLFYKTKIKEFNIPATVKKIGNQAFASCSALKKLGSSSVMVEDDTFFIPASVEEIGVSAFEGCKAVSNLVFENNSSLKVINEAGFKSLEKLTSVTLPDSLERIEKDGFAKCKVLAEINFSENSNISYISSDAFDGTNYVDKQHEDETIVLGKVLYQVNSSLLEENSLDLSDTSTYGTLYGISDELFAKSKATSIILPDTLKVIGKGTFKNCTKLTSISLPASLNEIGANAFEGCEDVETLTIDPNCTISVIKESTFDGMSSLTSIALPNTVKVIENSAFNDCSKLETITMSNAIEYIGESAFEDCKDLTSINLPKSLSYLGPKAFKNNESLENVTFDSDAFINALEEDKVLRAETFYGCEKLASITIPNYIVSIEADVFKNCKTLETVILGENTTDINGNAFSSSGLSNNFENGMVIIDDLLLKYEGTSKDIVIPGNIKVISKDAFSNSEIESIVIPSSVEEIGENAFLNCKNLKSITFSEGSTLLSVGNSAFSGCQSLLSISLPDSITELGEYAFYRCINLSSFNFTNDKLTVVPAHCFDSCNSLKTVTFHSNLVEIGEYAFYKTSFETVTLPNSVEKVGDYAFAYLGNAKNKLLEPSNWEIVPTLKSLDLSATKINEIGEYAFTNNILTSIALPSHELVLKDYCFANSSNIKEFVFEEKWEIHQGVFQGSNNISKLSFTTDQSVFNIFGGYITFIPSTLKEIVITGNGTTIAPSAFAGLGNLEKVTLPDTITYISDNAFTGCRNLEELTLENVEHIGNGAFLGCFKLDLELGNNISYIGEKAFTGTEYLNSFDKDSDGVIDDYVIINDILILYNGDDKNVVLNDSIKIIAGGAFAGNQTIESITGGANLDKICFGAFDSCTNLTSITLTSNDVVELELGTLDTLSDNLKLKVNKSLVKQYESDMYWSLYLDKDHIEGN